MALAASIVLALSVVLVQLSNQKPAATVVASTDAHLDTDLDISQGAAVATGKTLNLVTGNLELKLRGGADVVIEGPATFGVSSPVAMSLTRGASRRRGRGGTWFCCTDSQCTGDRPGDRVWSRSDSSWNHRG